MIYYCEWMQNKITKKEKVHRCHLEKARYKLLRVLFQGIPQACLILSVTESCDKTCETLAVMEPH